MRKGEIWFNKDCTIVIGGKSEIVVGGEHLWMVAPFGETVESVIQRLEERFKFHYIEVPEKTIRTHFRKYWG